MFRIHPTFFDVIAILLASFMLISILMSKNLQKEYLTKVDMLKKAVENQYQDTSQTDIMSLTVKQTKDKKYEFVLESKQLGGKTLYGVQQVKDELSKIRPGRVSLRIDRNVPTGITQELLYDAQKLGILPYLTVEKG